MLSNAVTVVPPGRLAVGMQLPIQSQSRLYVADWELTSGADVLVRIARAADDAGFFYIATCDHVAIPSALAPRMGTFWTDPVATLGLLAGVTQRVRLLSHVLVAAYRHPLVTAKAFATLDWLSAGRVIVGVGAGHVEAEFAALEVPFADRGRLTDDAIDVVRAALTEEFPEVTTPTWTLDGNVGLEPRPLQRPRPPIWVGGSSKPALRRAATRGDGWLPQGTAKADMPAAIAFLREHREQTVGDLPIDIGAITEYVYVGTPPHDPPFTKSGPPERIADALLEYAALGVQHVQIRFPARSADELVEQIGIFGAEVIPLLVTEPESR